jgi:ABC-type glycerol-3-phosphate transport system substrate-binding protein
MAHWTEISRRAVLLACGFAASSTLLSGCTLRRQDAGSSVRGQPQAEPSGTVEVWWNFSGAQQDEAQKLVDAFNTQQHRIKVNVSFIPGTWDDMRQKTLAAMAGGAPPEVIRISVFDVPMYADRGGLVDLSPYIAKDQRFAQPVWVPRCWENVVWKGKPYALPWNLSAVTLYYNKDRLSEAGVLAPPKTWEELALTAQRLTRHAEQKYGFRASYDASAEGMNYFGPILFSFGVDLFDSQVASEAKRAAFNTPQGLEALQFAVDLIWRYACVIPPGVNLPVNPVYNGNLAMWIDGQWGLPGIRANAPGLNFGTALLPGTRYANPGITVSGGNHIGVMEGSKNKDAGWVFASWVASDEQDYQFAVGGGYLPARQANYARPIYQTQPWDAFATMGLKHAKNRPAVRDATRILAAIMTEVQHAQHQRKSPKEALNDAERAVNQIFTETLGR